MPGIRSLPVASLGPSPLASCPCPILLCQASDDPSLEPEVGCCFPGKTSLSLQAWCCVLLRQPPCPRDTGHRLSPWASMPFALQAGLFTFPTQSLAHSWCSVMQRGDAPCGHWRPRVLVFLFCSPSLPLPDSPPSCPNELRNAIVCFCFIPGCHFPEVCLGEIIKLCLFYLLGCFSSCVMVTKGENRSCRGKTNVRAVTAKTSALPAALPGLGPRV